MKVNNPKKFLGFGKPVAHRRISGDVGLEPNRPSVPNKNQNELRSANIESLEDRQKYDHVPRWDETKEGVQPPTNNTNRPCAVGDDDVKKDSLPAFLKNGKETTCHDSSNQNELDNGVPTEVGEPKSFPIKGKTMCAKSLPPEKASLQKGPEYDSSSSSSGGSSPFSTDSKKTPFDQCSTQEEELQAGPNETCDFALSRTSTASSSSYYSADSTEFEHRIEDTGEIYQCSIEIIPGTDVVSMFFHAGGLYGVFWANEKFWTVATCLELLLHPEVSPKDKKELETFLKTKVWGDSSYILAGVYSIALYLYSFKLAAGYNFAWYCMKKGYIQDLFGVFDRVTSIKMPPMSNELITLAIISGKDPLNVYPYVPLEVGQN